MASFAIFCDIIAAVVGVDVVVMMIICMNMGNGDENYDDDSE